VVATAAGAFRRTAIERSDQRVSWERADRAFFAAGACHILAWTCQESYPDHLIEIAAMRGAGDQPVLPAYAAWNGWAFDHSGWNPESQLLEVNAHFEGRRLERFQVTESLAEFCRQHRHRMPHQYWQDPRPRARTYLSRHNPPWARRLRRTIPARDRAH
jgi:hypothetical protein